MIYISIVGFRSGKVGFVGMEFEAGIVQNTIIGKDSRANMSCKGSISNRNGGQIG
jgi:hypothetical protein